jgi:hypothetical protein
MGLYLRKSMKLGPMRVNLSKSGVGTSFGVKGFRVGVNASGKSYVHSGAGGIYYRSNLSGSGTNRAPSNTGDTKVPKIFLYLL